MCSFPVLGVGDCSLHLCQEVPLLHSHLHLSSNGGHGGCQPHDVRVCVVQCLYVCTVHGGGWRRAAQPHGWTPPALLGVPLLQHLFRWCVCVFVHLLCTCVSVNAESATIIAVGHSDDVVLLNCAVVALRRSKHSLVVCTLKCMSHDPYRTSLCARRKELRS